MANPIDRRTLLALMAVGLAAAPRRAHAGTLPKSLAVVVPTGAGSTVETAVKLVATGVAAAIGGRVLIDLPTARDRLAEALERVTAPGGTDLAILATDLLTQATWDVTADVGVRPTLERLTPIANLTPGYSTVMFVTAGSPLKDWKAFSVAARKETLALATPNAQSVHLRFLEAALKVAFTDAVATSRDALFAAVAGGTVAAGIVNTPSYIAYAAANPGTMRPVLTFGGQRNAVLAVPTLRDLTGNRRLATTNNVALLGGPDLDGGTAADLYIAFARAARQPAVVAAARRMGFPLAVEGPDAVRVTIARNKKVVAAAIAAAAAVAKAP